MLHLFGQLLIWINDARNYKHKTFISVFQFYNRTGCPLQQHKSILIYIVTQSVFGVQLECSGPLRSSEGSLSH